MAERGTSGHSEVKLCFAVVLVQAAGGRGQNNRPQKRKAPQAYLQTTSRRGPECVSILPLKTMDACLRGASIVMALPLQDFGDFALRGDEHLQDRSMEHLWNVGKSGVVKMTTRRLRVDCGAHVLPALAWQSWH